MKLIVGGIIGGILLGAGILFILARTNIISLNNQNRLVESQPSPVPATSINKEEVKEEARRKLESAKRQLLEEGFNSQGEAVELFPGMGFVIQDKEGTRLFVHWKGQQPQVAQKISVRGTAEILNQESLTRLEQEPGFNEKLKSFLVGQKVFIEAQEVTPAISTSPSG